MSDVNPIAKIQTELTEGMDLKKCRQCGCMQETLGNLRKSFSEMGNKNVLDLSENVQTWSDQMNPIKYSCLGCDYCYPAVASNIFNDAFPEQAEKESPGCGFEVKADVWPVVPGEYFVCDAAGTVAISTLASVELAEKLADLKPEGLCIVGKTETENIGIDKVVKNIITNPAIQYLLLAGQEPKKHCSGHTLLSLWKSGVDQNMRVIGASGKRPILKNVSISDVEAFREQVKIVDMIGCEDIDAISVKISELSRQAEPSCGCRSDAISASMESVPSVPIIQAQDPENIQMDKAGYFVILPLSNDKKIRVEHYTYDNTLARIIEGGNARDIYWTIIENKWVTQLSHAAYLGKELTRAELSMKFDFQYVQDGA